MRGRADLTTDADRVTAAVWRQRPPAPADVSRRKGGDARAFTIIELMVVAAIIAVLLALLLPALARARGQMKAVKCASNLRSVGLTFQLFVERQEPKGWGDSNRLSRPSFYINDFLDRLYRIDEYWDLPGRSSGNLYAKDEVMMCPAGAPRLTRYAGMPCSSASIQPARDISLAVNMRLQRAVVEFMGQTVLAPAAATRVRPDILNHPYAPLALDIDGQRAMTEGLEPFYTAPPLPDDVSPYGDGRYWLPAKRHGGRVNVAFVGGHVLSSEHPEQEAWDWRYQAHVGN